MKPCKKSNPRAFCDFSPPTSEHDSSPISVSWGAYRARTNPFKKPPVQPVIRVPKSIRNEEQFWTVEERNAAYALFMMANAEIPREADQSAHRNPARITEIPIPPWPITKVLTETDTKTDQNRLLLKRVEAINHIMEQLDDESREKVYSDFGLKVKILDVDTQENLDITFKWWKSSKSYILQGGWHTNFVVRRKLKKGDEIRLLWSAIDKMLFFSVLQQPN